MSTKHHIAVVRSVGCEPWGIAVHTLSVGRVSDCFRLGVLVLHVVGLGMNLFMFLEVLRTLEFLIADLAVVRFQGYVHAEVGGDVVALCTCSVAILPLTCER